MSIVGIDPSLTACGIAVLDRDTVDVLTSGGVVHRTDQTAPTHITSLISVGHPGRDSDGWDERSDRVVSQSRFVLSKIPGDAELVVIEGPSYGSSNGNAFDRAALWMGIYSSLRARKVPIAVCAPGTREKWATGNVIRGLSTRERKARVLAAVREQWPNERRLRTDNEADGLTLAGMGALHLGWLLPFEIKPRHHTGLDAVTWPKEKDNA